MLEAILISSIAAFVFSLTLVIFFGALNMIAPSKKPSEAYRDHRCIVEDLLKDRNAALHEQNKHLGGIAKRVDVFMDPFGDFIEGEDTEDEDDS